MKKINRQNLIVFLGLICSFVSNNALASDNILLDTTPQATVKDSKPGNINVEIDDLKNSALQNYGKYYLNPELKMDSDKYKNLDSNMAPIGPSVLTPRTIVTKDETEYQVKILTTKPPEPENIQTVSNDIPVQPEILPSTTDVSAPVQSGKLFGLFKRVK